MKEPKPVCFCELCGRKITEGTRVFEGYMARLFIASVKDARDMTVEWSCDRADKKAGKVSAFLRDVVLSDTMRQAGQATQYTRLGDLKHWGLLSQAPEHWHQGIYQVTDFGKSFLRGEVKIPKRVVIRNGKVVSEDKSDMVDIETALRDKWNEIADWITDWRSTNPVTSQRELF